MFRCYKIHRCVEITIVSTLLVDIFIIFIVTWVLPSGLIPTISFLTSVSLKASLCAKSIAIAI